MTESTLADIDDSRPSKTFTIDKTKYSSRYTTSAASPLNTHFNHQPSLGDVHGDQSNGELWVWRSPLNGMGGLQWVKHVGENALTHPKSCPGHQHTWNKKDHIWQRHGMNKNPTSQTVEGVHTRQRKKKDDAKDQSALVNPEAGPSTQKRKTTKRKVDKAGESQPEKNQPKSKKLARKRIPSSDDNPQGQEEDSNDVDVDLGLRQEGESSRRIYKKSRIVISSSSENEVSLKKQTEDLDPRWAAVMKTIEAQQIRHEDIRQNALKILKILSQQQLHYVGDSTTGNLITPAPQWSCNGGEYSNDLMWEDVTYANLNSLIVSSRGHTVTGFYTLAQIIENWQANGPPLDVNDPQINFVQIFHQSPRGVKVLQLAWPQNPALYFVESMPGTSTFTQAGNITPPHIDGFGLSQSMAHLDGDKIWIVWPPTDFNIRAVRDHDRSLGPNRETRLERWLDILQEPKVFLMRKGDSFLLGASVIHACISLTPSAHYGVFCWRRDSLQVAALNVSIFKEGYSKLRDSRAKVISKRKSQDKEKVGEVEKASREADQLAEDALYTVCSEFYKGCKKEWMQTDSQAWKQIKKGGKDEELERFYKETHSFMRKIDESEEEG